ncbi:PulJ/GspJ family protein [Flagellimonas sp.]|uniref:PulJ/GspJ family protein n=1 Tax=Flagellimonas sp. TaxID=2058762 RepID=UPI003F49DD35
MPTIQKKIPSFTLSEMLVVLLLTVIVVGLAFSVLALVNKQMSDMEGNYEKRTENNVLRQAMCIDFNSNGEIEYSLAWNKLVLRNEMDSTVYLFRDKLIIRAGDTIKTDLKILRVLNKGVQVSGGPVDAIELGSPVDSSQTFFVFKRNAAIDFIN